MFAKKLLPFTLLVFISFLLSSCGGEALEEAVEVKDQNRFSNEGPPVLVFTVQPATSFINTTFTADIIVTSQKENGDTYTPFDNKVTLSIETDGAGGGTTLVGTTEVYASSGVATFSGLNLDQVGTNFTLKAQATGYDEITSSQFDIIYDPAVLEFSATSTYDYGSIFETQTSDATFTITNTGNSTATSITDSAFTTNYQYKDGTFPGTGGDCSTTLAASASCTVVVTFAPTSAGTFLDTISIDYNDANEAQNASRSLTGVGVDLAELSISDGATYIYSDTNVGSYLDKTFVLSNTSASTANSISEVALSAPFTFADGTFPGTGGTCTTTLSSGSSCTFIVRFTPTAATTSNETITLNYDNGISTVQATRAIQGTGLSTTPTQLGLSGPDAVIASECVEYEIQSLDASGNLANVTSNTNASITINNGTGNFYSDAGCTSIITSTTINASTSSTTLYFSSVTAPQNLTTIFTTASLSAGRKDIDVGSTPIAINITAPAEMESDSCTEIEVALIDGTGNKIGSSTGETVNLSQDQSTTFYSDSFCTGSITSINFSAYDGVESIYVKQSSVSVVTLTATDAMASLTTDNATVSVVAALTWWNTSWDYRKSITLNNLDQAATFTNIPIKVSLTSSNFTYANAMAAGEDLRFTLDDQTTELDYEIEKWNTSGESIIWVLMPSVTASTQTTIYMYYGNGTATDNQNAGAVWTDYSGIWHLGEDPSASAPQFTDSTVNANHATAEGSVSLETAQISDGLKFNGGGDAIDVGFDLSSIIGRTSTLSFWVKTTQVGHNTNWRAPGITGVEQAGGGNDIFFGFIDASGALAVNSGNAGVAKSNFVINDDAWRFVTMHRNETDGAVSFYVDGVQNGTGTSETGHKSTAFSKFGVISDTGGTPLYFEGTLDEIRLYTGIMSDDRIRADFKFMKGTHTSYGSEENAP